MRRRPALVGLIVAAALVNGAHASAAAPLEPPTWSDEFNATSLDLTRWSHRATGPRHDGTITADAVSVGAGVLTIKTYTEAGQHFSGMIGTQRVGSAGFEQRYGYMEARLKFNTTPGQWSAFWLQSPTIGNPLGDPAAAGVEMDIAEHRARCVDAPSPTPPATCSSTNDIRNRTQQAVIWDGYAAGISKAAVKLSDPLEGLGNDSWHTWALRWTPTDLTFYYDDVETWSRTTPISRRSQYVTLSSAVGRFFAGQIPAAGYGSRETSTTNMQVDYVRVWEHATVPANTVAPAASGTPELGQVLACSPGSWSGTPAPTFSYQWDSDGSPIGAASTAPSYTVRSADQGHALSCRVTATNTAGAVSAPSNAVLVPSPRPLAPPAVLAAALPVPAAPPTVGSSRCAPPRLLSASRRGAAFRVRVRTHCRGTLSLKARTSVAADRRRVAVVVRARGRLVSGGARTVNLSFARSARVGRARRAGRRLPVVLVITFAPQAGGPAHTVRRQLLIPSTRSARRR